MKYTKFSFSVYVQKSPELKDGEKYKNMTSVAAT